ncbi:MAG: PH domain-containing protein, partial [Haloechinothrix sp.]
LALAAITAHALLVRPRLTADRHGIVVRTLSGSSRAQWAEVHARLASTRRLGRDVKTLELELGRADTEPHLIVLGRFELGAEPADVLDELERVRSG